MATDDDTLLARAQSGDHEAFATLLEDHAPRVRKRLDGAIPRRLRSMLSEDDVMQQTYVDAFCDLDRFQPQGSGSFAAWLATLARRNLLDAIKMLDADKRGGRWKRLRGRAPGRDTSVGIERVLAVTMTTPSRRVAGREARSYLERAIEALPEHYRIVVQMYDLEERPVEEVARTLDRSQGAVYMLRARAHRLLRETMGAASRFLSESP